MSQREFTTIGQRVPMTDGPPKVTGTAVYADDLRLPNMLHGKILRSPHAHARIVSIDTSKAEALPGVMGIVTGKDGKRKVFSKIDVLPPGTICNETYLVIGSYKSEAEAKNLVGYMKTRFFRFLVSQFMYSHHITKESYALVPIQNTKQTWTDEKLYKKYGIIAEEIEFIESLIRPMELNG